MKTLYLSDLDGTLLRPDETISDFTAGIINNLVSRGTCFSFATARSRTTALKVTGGITVRLPLIVYNGAFIADSTDGSLLYKNTFSKEQAAEIYRCFRENSLAPVAYSLQNGRERFSYVLPEVNERTLAFLRTRAGDPRDTPLENDSAMLDGDVFYFNCIGEEKELKNAYLKLKGSCECLYYDDSCYSGDRWLELMPGGASKAAAARELKKLTGAERLVVFGDSVNDLELFELADEAYAVENAVPELKERADAVIGPNSEDAVARWLAENIRI